MLLILEIALVVTVWRKGWKGFALVPAVVALIAGAAMGAMGSPTWALTLVDVALIGVLSVMATQGRPTAEVGSVSVAEQQ